jgi:hypothetical protein
MTASCGRLKPAFIRAAGTAKAEDAPSTSSQGNASSCTRCAGLLLNNEMDDFSTPGQPNVYNLPPAKANFIRPGAYLSMTTRHSNFSLCRVTGSLYRGTQNHSQCLHCKNKLACKAICAVSTMPHGML